MLHLAIRFVEWLIKQLERLDFYLLFSALDAEGRRAVRDMLLEKVLNQ